MRILAIETSCDETAVALLEITGEPAKPEVKILGNSLYSQVKVHEQYGGVFPMLAKREHIKNLPILLEKTLREAGESVEAPELDFIAVTQGPGLEPALWTGIEFAENLGKKWGKPVLPVNHMEGHIWSVLPGLKEGEPLRLPALALLISGGHTELVYIREFGAYEILGRTLDDAAGEAFDKVARLLGLPYPGGPEITRLAEIARNKAEPAPSGDEMASRAISFPRPMLRSGNLDFSFSGLKTAVLYKVKADGRKDAAYTEEVARAFEDAVMDVLLAKTRQALGAYDAKSLIVAGGVSASPRVRELFQNLMATEFPEVALLFPAKGLATDNAVMIGVAAYVKTLSRPESLSPHAPIEARGNLSFN
jgi:N6-L-threonylcarbamoyladenine synthase